MALRHRFEPPPQFQRITDLNLRKLNSIQATQHFSRLHKYKIGSLNARPTRPMHTHLAARTQACELEGWPRQDARTVGTPLWHLWPRSVCGPVNQSTGLLVGQPPGTLEPNPEFSLVSSTGRGVPTAISRTCVSPVSGNKKKQKQKKTKKTHNIYKALLLPGRNITAPQ